MTPLNFTVDDKSMLGCTNITTAHVKPTELTETLGCRQLLSFLLYLPVQLLTGDYLDVGSCCHASTRDKEILFFFVPGLIFLSWTKCFILKPHKHKQSVKYVKYWIQRCLLFTVSLFFCTVDTVHIHLHLLFTNLSLSQWSHNNVYVFAAAFKFINCPLVLCLMLNC